MMVTFQDLRDILNENFSNRTLRDKLRIEITDGEYSMVYTTELCDFSLHKDDEGNLIIRIFR